MIIISFIIEAMKNWQVKWRLEGNLWQRWKSREGSSWEMHLRRIGNCNSVNYILRKCTGRHKFLKSQEKINHLIYIDNIKLFAKNEEGFETDITIRIYSQDVEMEFGKKKQFGSHPYNEKWKKSINEGNSGEKKPSQIKKDSNRSEKRKLGNIESRLNETSGDWIK